MQSRSAIALVLLAAAVFAQSPATAPADPGPSQTLPGGLITPVGYEHASLFNVQPGISLLASIVTGPGGHLYFTETVGTGCNASGTTLIYRVQMNGNTPVQPVAISAFSTVPIEAHVLTYDPVTDALYAGGTCGQTSQVFKIPPSGVPQALNPSSPLNDPDSVAVGFLPGSGTPHLFTAVQDDLVAIDLLTLASTVIQVDLTQVPATSLGNWSPSLVWDPNTQTLLATNVGRPVVRNTVEITFTSATTAVAQIIAPDNHLPLMVDQQGVRYFGLGAEIGIINPGGPAGVLRTMIGGLATSGIMIPAPEGGFYLAQPSIGQVDRLDRPLTVNRLEVPASVAGSLAINVRAPAPRGNEGYLVVCGVTGGTPGTAYGPTIMPVNADIITQVAVAMVLANDPVTQNWGGMMPANGQVNALMYFPAGVIPSGITIQFGFALGNPEYSSNSAWVHVVP